MSAPVCEGPGEGLNRAGQKKVVPKRAGRDKPGPGQGGPGLGQGWGRAGDAATPAAPWPTPGTAPAKLCACVGIRSCKLCGDSPRRPTDCPRPLPHSVARPTPGDRSRASRPGTPAANRGDPELRLAHGMHPIREAAPGPVAELCYDANGGISVHFGDGRVGSREQLPVPLTGFELLQDIVED